MNDDIIKIDEDAEALVNLGYAISAGEVTRADLEAMEWFKHPKTETERRYKKTFLQVFDEMEAGNVVLYPDPVQQIPIPSQAEIDEMDDFGQYISWILKHNGKAPE